MLIPPIEAIAERDIFRDIPAFGCEETRLRTQIPASCIQDASSDPVFDTLSLGRISQVTLGSFVTVSADLELNNCPIPEGACRIGVTKQRDLRRINGNWVLITEPTVAKATELATATGGVVTHPYETEEGEKIEIDIVRVLGNKDATTVEIRDELAIDGLPGLLKLIAPRSLHESTAALIGFSKILTCFLPPDPLP